MSHPREQIRAQLLADMASQHLRPGDQVRIDRWAQRIRLSAIPVREELWRLAGEGLLVARSGVGFFIPRLNAEDLAQLYRARRFILLASLDTLTVPFADRVELDGDPGETMWFDRLCDALVRKTQDHAIGDLWHRTNLRLAPYGSNQSAARTDERLAIVAGLSGSDRAAARKAVTRLMRRREREAAATVRCGERARTSRI